jgi:hypothetical protein
MATIRLGRYEAKVGDLPQVCMRCGEAATEFRPKVFSRSPWWIYVSLPIAFAVVLVPGAFLLNEWVLPLLPLGLVPFFALAFFLNQRMLIRAPLCDLHHFHWRWRSLALVAGLVLPIVAAYFVFSLHALAPGENFFVSPARTVIAFAMAAILAGVWIALAIGLKLTAIHETGIDQNGLTLTGVADEFVEALRVHRTSGRVS